MAMFAKPPDDESSDAAAADEKEEKPGLTPRRQQVVVTEIMARTTALEILRRRRAGEVSAVRVYAGTGQSGAASVACARHLANYAVPCLLYLVGGRGRAEPLLLKQLTAWDRMRGMTVNLHNGDEALGTLPTLGADELTVSGVTEGEQAGELPGQTARIAMLIGPALAERSSEFNMILEYDRKFRPAMPADGDAVVDIDVPAVSRQQARLFDSVAIESYGIPGLALMENAGWRAAREAFRMRAAGKSDDPVLVLCGKGNNGGDGFVIARYLKWWGVPVACLLDAEAASILDDALVNLHMLELEGVAVERLDRGALSQRLKGSSLVVDALLGTGLTRTLRDDMLQAVGAINQSGRPVLAVDTPTGLDCDTGAAFGDVVRARRTVTFGTAKKGFLAGEGPNAVGDLVVADIGLPRALWDAGDGGAARPGPDDDSSNETNSEPAS
jgi:NAD(P)H-hydrate epimerase